MSEKTNFSRKWCVGRFCIACVLALWSVPGRSTPAASLSFARELSEKKEHLAAALEYRRLTLLNEFPPAEIGAFYWMAAYEYGWVRRFEQANRMLGEVENVSPDLENEVALLRGELGMARRQFGEALFYWETLAESDRPEPFRRYAARKGASAALALGKVEQARQLLSRDPKPPSTAFQAISAYEKGRDKSPLVGGFLGLIPGLGYAYSGEYANGLRSLLMNALCIWGVFEFAEREQWAGVALVGFAELTFYSGSVYGGADAAVRFNERRRGRTQQAIEGGARFEPDLAALPLLKLRFEF